MTTHAPPPRPALCGGEIPPAAHVRQRLAETTTEAALLRRLLRLAERRERAAARLDHVNRQTEEVPHAG
jgi:hypothetical protein